MKTLLALLLFVALPSLPAATPRWEPGTVAKPARVNFEVRIPGELGDAAVRAVRRWDAEVRPLGLRLTTSRPWLRLDRPKPKNGRNEIWLGSTADDGWGDAVRDCDWGATRPIFTECDIRLDRDRPYTADYVYRVALHEIGHALGLNHLPSETAMMFYRGPALHADLYQPDLAALFQRYPIAKKK